jgi:cytochrome P450
MNIWNCHRNEAIFPDAEKFDPERWLSEDSSKLEKYLVPFGSGSRMCIGMKYAAPSDLNVYSNCPSAYLSQSNTWF